MMIKITLPDGKCKEFANSVSVADVAASIGSGLARAAIAGKIISADGATLVDLSYQIAQDCQLAIITEKDQEGLEIIRHSCAHLLAYAVKSLYPQAQVTIGPVIENGFYYDFAYAIPFSSSDLEKIEAKMLELAKEDISVQREVWQRDNAVEFFLQLGEKYKAEIIASIPANQDISLYRQGDFIDLCRGPHVASTGKIKAFKLTKVAGAYWRGDANNEMLQRIYGTAFASKADLDEYLLQIEEAEKRDHRKIAKQHDLFHMQDAAPGLVFWHPKGWAVWQEVEQYMRKVYRDNGYQEVKCPQILDRVLWEKSGHWEHYKDNMFTTHSENRDYALKPMNCPGHIQVYNSHLHSYRELPIRYGEFGSCHRNEPSGALHGLMRVRGFTQDDGHIFCSEQQIEAEVTAFNMIVQKVYADFGFKQIAVKLALRPKSRVGSDEIWDKAEQALRQALKASNLEWLELPGEGAFYGPKIEFHIKDAIGRSWQCGTMQVDFFMPQRLGAEYVASDDQRKIPVMLHRAILGSLERFIGILLENHAGALPLWLAPIQAVVLNVSEKQAEYATAVARKLREHGLRVELDLRNEKINYKIREHSEQRIPYQLVVGDKEKESAAVSVRKRGNVTLGAIAVDELLSLMLAEINQRG